MKFRQTASTLASVGLAIASITGLSAVTLSPQLTETAIAQEAAPTVTTTSSANEIALAKHLRKIGAKLYTAYWCPHCHEQKQLFGKEAYKILQKKQIIVECAADSPKGQPEVCQAAKITGFPSWIINGQTYSGVQNLEQLARISGYTGPNNFKYFR